MSETKKELHFCSHNRNSIKTENESTVEYSRKKNISSKIYIVETFTCRTYALSELPH